jgi:predicted DNA binding CopG/RHH family protein
MAHQGVKAKTKAVTVKLTSEQYRLVERRALDRDLPLGVWIRQIITHAATREPDMDGYLRIREPDGVTT